MLYVQKYKKKHVRGFSGILSKKNTNKDHIFTIFSYIVEMDEVEKYVLIYLDVLLWQIIIVTHKNNMPLFSVDVIKIQSKYYYWLAIQLFGFF